MKYLEFKKYIFSGSAGTIVVAAAVAIAESSSIVATTAVVDTTTVLLWHAKLPTNFLVVGFLCFCVFL